MITQTRQVNMNNHMYFKFLFRFFREIKRIKKTEPDRVVGHKKMTRVGAAALSLFYPTILGKKYINVAEGSHDLILFCRNTASKVEIYTISYTDPNFEKKLRNLCQLLRSNIHLNKERKHP